MARADEHSPRFAETPASLRPDAIPEPRGVGDPRHKKCREHALDLRSGAGAGEEFLDEIGNSIDIAGPDRMVAAGDFGELRALHPSHEIAAGFGIHMHIATAMDKEGRNADARQIVAHVDRSVRAYQRSGCRRTCRQPFEARPPIGKTLIVDAPRSKMRQRCTTAPTRFGGVDENPKAFGRHHPFVETRVAAIEHQRARCG